MSCGGWTDQKTAKDPFRAYAWLPLASIMTTKQSHVYGMSLHLLELMDNHLFDIRLHVVSSQLWSTSAW